MSKSSDVIAGSDILAAQYNNLRDDALTTFARNFVNKSGGVVAAKKVVIGNMATAEKSFETTDRASSRQVLGVTRDSVDADDPGDIIILGEATVEYTGAAPAAGDWMETSATAGKAQTTSRKTPTAASFAIALEAGAGGEVDVFVTVSFSRLYLSAEYMAARGDAMTTYTWDGASWTTQGAAGATQVSSAQSGGEGVNKVYFPQQNSVTAQEYDAGAWANITNGGHNKQRHGCAIADDYLCWGGGVPSYVTNTTSFDLTSSYASEAVVPAGRGYHDQESISDETDLYRVRGQNSSGTKQSDNHEYSGGAGGTWATDTSAPTAAADSSGAKDLQTDNLWFIGGYTTSAQARADEYDTGADSWTSGTYSGDLGSDYDLGCAWLDSDVIITGGSSASTSAYEMSTSKVTASITGMPAAKGSYMGATV